MKSLVNKKVLLLSLVGALLSVSALAADNAKMSRKVAADDDETPADCKWVSKSKQNAAEQACSNKNETYIVHGGAAGKVMVCCTGTAPPMTMR
jgi:hypothetical protein